MRGACSSAGEHYVDIVGVTGSIPVTPTILCFIKVRDLENLQKLSESRVFHHCSDFFTEAEKLLMIVKSRL